MALTSKPKKKVKSRLCHVNRKPGDDTKNATCVTNNLGSGALEFGAGENTQILSIKKNNKKGHKIKTNLPILVNSQSPWTPSKDRRFRIPRAFVPKFPKLPLTRMRKRKIDETHRFEAGGLIWCSHCAVRRQLGRKSDKTHEVTTELGINSHGAGGEESRKGRKQKRLLCLYDDEMVDFWCQLLQKLSRRGRK